MQQRTHKVWEDAGDGGLYVQLSTEPAKLSSDQYACMPACGDRVINGKGGGGPSGPNVGGDGRKPSGGGAPDVQARIAGRDLATQEFLSSAGDGASFCPCAQARSSGRRARPLTTGDQITLGAWAHNAAALML